MRIRSTHTGNPKTDQASRHSELGNRVVALICDAQQAGHEGGSESCHIDGH